VKIGLFGGSFDPVHNGHINAAVAFADALALDRVIIMPAHTPPHKEAPNMASTEDRLAMCRLAFNGDERFVVSDYEIQHDEKSYTITTLKYLRQKYPKDELYLLMGGDMLLYFRRWYRWTSIGKMAILAGAARHDDEHAALEAEAETLRSFGLDVRVIPIDVLDISSTEVRKAIRNTKDTSALIPREVAAYIFERGLYMKDDR